MRRFFADAQGFLVPGHHSHIAIPTRFRSDPPSYLTKSEFESLPWSVLMLMGGGLAMGTAIECSGLLRIIADK
jgi:hypothetical protein